jgi:hypothetical protein
MEATNKRGRKPAGLEYVQNLEGSEEAKRRLQVVLETLTGQRGVQQACQLLAISETRFQQLRHELLQAALERLERKPAGRPRATPAPADVGALQEQLAEMTKELESSRVREEVALILGRGQAESGAQKKTPVPPKRRARPGWWKK